MRVLVINLDRATERLAFQQRQLTRLGLDWERLVAVDTATPDDRTQEYWEGWQRPMALAERACLRSHVAAWRRVCDAGAPMLILEDDALLAETVPSVLKAAALVQDVDLLQLETRGRAKRLGLENRSIGPVQMRPLYLDRAGAAGYVLWPSGAERLLAQVALRPALADAAIASPGLLRAWQVVPAQIIQNDMAETYGQASGWPVEASSVSARSHRRAAKSVAQRLRRVAAQLQLGLRQMKGPAEWVNVPYQGVGNPTTMMSVSGGDGP